MLTQLEALAIAAQAADRHIQRVHREGGIVAATAEFFNECAYVGMRELEALEPGRWKVSADMDDWRSPRMVVELASPPPLAITVTMSGENPPPFVKRATMNWHTDPPEWAAYVSSVVAINRGDEVHLAIEMRSKRVDCSASVGESGEVRVTFYATPSTLGEGGRYVVWPDDLGPWPETETLPSLIVNVGADRDLELVGQHGPWQCPNNDCPHRITYRYSIVLSLVRRVDWQDETTVQEVAGP